MTGRRVWLLVGLLAVVATVGCVSGALGGGEGSQTELNTSIEFRDATNESGLDYRSVKTGGVGNGNEGVFLADVDRDGWQDALLVGGERPVLYENDGGEFTRSGELAGLDSEFRSATFVDVDGDGWRDLLLFGTEGGTVAYENDEGTLSRTDYGLPEFDWPLGATAADFDGDGDRDLFVYQSGYWGDGKPTGYFSLTGQIEADNGNPNVLYENVGGEFRRVEDAGLSGDHWSLAASAVDMNDDDRPDVYVANDFYYDTVYLNRGNGTFDRRMLGNATARNGMSAEVGDVNDDSHPDVFVTNIYLPLKAELSPERYERVKRYLDFVIKSGRTNGNTLLVNDAAGEFTDEAVEYDVRDGGWGWAASFADFDNDRQRDLFQTTQHIIRLDQENPHYTYPMLWERTGENFTGLDASDHGLKERDGRGMVTFDYDRDGDVDALTANYAGPATLYENAGETGNAVQVRAVDGANRTAYGAEITVVAGGETLVDRLFGSEGTVLHQTDRTDFLSQESQVRHVGLGRAETATIRVEWPDGTERTLDVDAGQRVRVSKDGHRTVDIAGP